MSFTCDIFCAVVDNYGDIGVCWRLAKCLRDEGVAVRLWVDDLASFAKLCPELDATSQLQLCRGVEVRRWSQPFPATTPAPLVIEAFACKLPPDYLAAMAAMLEPPLWVNLEYLSGEDWVEGCHRLPSPHPTLPLTRHFFFPGFSPKTGGLLLERDLLARRDAFQRDPQAITAYWRSLDLPAPEPDELRVSLFGYENAAVSGLLREWSEGARAVTCLVPEGRILPQVAEFFGFDEGAADAGWRRGNLRVRVLPFVEQERYDTLLWACDVNFVRGEDSCVRAQWAARPFVWQIYPQHDGVHLDKLRALLARYGAGMPSVATAALSDLWLAWNTGADAGAAWEAFEVQRAVFRSRAEAWSASLAGHSLALNLLDFCRETGRMRAFEFSSSFTS
ncbi:elongation factor P maturation arginine rhamnosyltransferase EarP [Ferriphaselus sp. R-1]|uniref:elongation factor P maturation arginine rhamnosyltransferase EarP n=1 Tax=Ferriphaselus sp. R-1 TaxID=1485544 RepID=UPI00054F6B27|nr:elongation factor P maturation arginine rhamnosyltransferase EarP [Ferriphaselus sp. R-1]